MTTPTTPQTTSIYDATVNSMKAAAPKPPRIREVRNGEIIAIDELPENAPRIEGVYLRPRWQGFAPMEAALIRDRGSKVQFFVNVDECRDAWIEQLLDGEWCDDVREVPMNDPWRNYWPLSVNTEGIYSIARNSEYGHQVGSLEVLAYFSTGRTFVPSRGNAARLKMFYHKVREVRDWRNGRAWDMSRTQGREA